MNILPLIIIYGSPCSLILSIVILAMFVFLSAFGVLFLFNLVDVVLGLLLATLVMFL